MNHGIEISTIEMDVVIYPEDNCWIAQGLQHDITARGSSPVDAANKFTKAVGAEVIMSIEIGDTPLLSGVAPAPQKFWKMYQDAELCVQKAETPIGLPELPNAPRIVPRLRISDKRLVAA